MILVWRDYRSDTGAIYPFLPLAMGQRNANEIASTFDPKSTLSESDRENILVVDRGCSVPLLQPRQIILYASDGGQFYLDYYRSFTNTLFDNLSRNTEIQAFEFIGERIKHSRLIRMLDRG